MESAGAELQHRRGRLIGAAPVRLALVIAVILFQSIEVSESYARLIATPLWILASILYPALFALSGFLLAGSSARYEGWRFLLDRTRRLVPALVIAVLLASLVLGPLASTMALTTYLRDRDFALYFLNLVAWPQFVLPAVFDFNNVEAIVNLPLWLSPFVVAMVVLALATRRLGSLFVFAILLAVIGVSIAVPALTPSLAGTTGLLRKALDGSGGAVVVAFLLGVLGYRLRDRLPISVVIAGLAIAALVGAALAGNRAWSNLAAFNLLIVVPAAYLALFAAFQRLALQALAVRFERYLTGMLLFAYPIQQTWIAFGPRQQPFWLNLLLALPTAAILAALAWHLVQQRLFGAGRDDPRFDVDRGPIMLRLSREEILDRLPQILSITGIALVVLLVLLAVMAMTILAFQPESGGV